MGFPTEDMLVREQAENAWREEKYDRAEELYRKVAAMPHHEVAVAEELFFADAAKALADGAEFHLIAPLAQASERAIDVAAKTYDSSEPYYDCCGRVVSAMINVTSCHYEAVEAYWKKEQKKHRRSPEALVGAESLLTECVNTVGMAAKQTVGAALEHARDLSAAGEYFWNALLTLLDNAATWRFSAEMGGDPEIAALLEEIDRLRGNVFGDFTGVEELPEDEAEYVEAVCPSCGETLSFPAGELVSGGTAECPFCGAAVGM